MSENISVTSIVGRFLEHTRIYYFRNGGNEEILLGSADLMPRNLDRRVEVIFPVENTQLKEALWQMLDVHLHDNVKARRMLPDGTYDRVQPQPGEELIDAQQWCLDHRGIWHAED